MFQVILLEILLKKFSDLNNDWDSLSFQLLCRYFGFKVNNEAFERLSEQLPHKIIAKHSNNSVQIEALLFGVAGFLEEKIDNDLYFNTLKSEYRFLSAKYNLTNIGKQSWKFLRLRPNNFPTIRIAQLASILYQRIYLYYFLTF